jgi:hypothetical protein
MSILEKIAFFQNRRDEVPNQELARQLAASRDPADIREIADNLWNQDQNIQSDCLKVLYELGYLAPDLITGYAPDFLKLLKNRNNRLVWGAMIALSTIAPLQAELLAAHIDEIQKVMAVGSVITNDAGMKTLAAVAAKDPAARATLCPYLLKRLASARPVDAPRYAEVILQAIDAAHQAEFLRLLDKWIDSAPAARLPRLKKARKQAQGIT